MIQAPDDNSSGASRPVLYDLAEEWRAFDALPKSIREALAESPFNYSAKEVLDALEQVLNDPGDNYGIFQSLVRGVDRPTAVRRLLGMLRQNIDNDMAEYRALLRGVPRKH